MSGLVYGGALCRWSVVLSVVSVVFRGGVSAVDEQPCRHSEFYCDTGQCVALDKFCDGEDNCGDKSDEPKYCSPCNRTYYGDVGRTYELEIRRPREDKLPFLCHLNFTAAGSSYGDLVQLTFDTFTVGKFVSFTSEGCPDGHMSIREEGLPAPQGQWCGSAWGYTVYYSERSSLNLTLQLDRLSQMGIGYNFDFKLAYKFLKRSEAKLRYGNSSATIWRGDLVEGSYCDRVLANCDKRPCRIQSPNYPGVYPRNVTCLYKIEHTKAPPGKHALLAVRQTNSHKIHIKDQIVKYDRSQRVLKIWDQCNIVQDYLTVYDGGNKNSPVLVRLCGGDAVPDIISSGPKMLLEFHTSPFDNPFHPVPLSYLPGFELEVQVLFMESNSHSYVREDGRCEFLLNTFDASSGILRNPRHSLPPNTTCRYHFQGRSNEIVWISFIKYYAASPDPAAFDQGTDCNAQLRIWDGRVVEGDSEDKNNASLLGEFCKEEVPKLCDHTLLSNSTRSTRPCSLQESYVTTGPEMTIEQVLRQGSALYPIVFLLRYEFVDISQQGQPIGGSHGICDRVFRSTPGSQITTGRFQSPKSIFYYGRGGSQNMSCILRFEANRSERIRLSFTKTAFGNKKCTTYKDTKTGRWKCDHSYTRMYRSISSATGVGFAELRITEYPWQGIALPRDCICSNMTETVTIHTLTSSVVEVNLTITMMNITEDFNDFGFEGEYQFIPTSTSEDNVCSNGWSDRRLKGSSGEISLRNPKIDDLPTSEVISDTNIVSESVRSDDPAIDNCIHQPWLIEPMDSNSNFIYVKIKGFEINQMSPSVCPTANRVFIYHALDTSNPKEICPEPSAGYDKSNFDVQTVGLFSKGWKLSGDQSDSRLILEPNSRSFVVEFIQREAGKYTFKWMEVSKRPAMSASSSSFVSSMSSAPIILLDCPYRCPELNACISSSLWCDGVNHCPSGFDEEDSNCAFHFGIPTLYIMVGGGAFLFFFIPIIFTLCIRYCKRKCKEKKKIKAQLEANSSSNNHLHVNHMHSNGSSIGRYQIPPTETYVRTEPSYGTTQKYATIDKFMGSKYSSAERYGINDARFNTDSRYDPGTDDRYVKDTPDLRYGGTLGRYSTHHSNMGSRYGSTKGVTPSTEDMYIEGKDSFC